MVNRWSHRYRIFGAALLLSALCAAAQADKPVDKAPMEISARPPHHINHMSSTGPIGLAPSQIQHAYGFDQLAAPGAYNSLGAGQTIAIVDAYGSPTIQKDLNTFSAQYGLPATTVQIAYPTGTPRGTDAGWALETALDVEWAHAIAPGATILLVAAKTASFGNLLACVDYAASRARQVSMSWGAGEFYGEWYYDYHFSNKPGVTFTASSGDNGAGVEWPAASPYVTSVGGTTLYLDSSNNLISETAWSGSGGGISYYEYEPSYQYAWQSSGARTVPDVSYNGDPNTGVAVYDSTPYSGYAGWWEVGGTSAGAPQWAALAAIANVGRTSALGQVDATLYSLSTGSSYHTLFDDVLTGNNGGYSAGAGYDMVTGLGSPFANHLVPTLNTSAALH
jgi:subtilase family serine protease